MHALTLALLSEAGANTGPDLTRYFAVCGVLLGAIGLLAWGFRKLIAGNLSLRAAKRNLQILDVLPMGGKQKLAVVRCYDRAFLIFSFEACCSASASMNCAKMRVVGSLAASGRLPS